LIETLLPLLGFVALTAGNAFFVAAEFGLVTVDRAAIDQMAAERDPVAVTIRRSLRQLTFQLSGAQLGITITALLTGYLAEPALASLLRPLLGFFGSATDTMSHVVALAIATLISLLFGELVPKNAAIARPMRTARLTAGPLLAFSRVFGWLIRLLNGSANWLVRRLGVEPQEELRSARSPEELGLLAAYSARAGALPEETATLLRRTIRFGEKRAAEAMTPRVDVIGVPAATTVQTVLDRIVETGKSRFPVYDETLDQVVGVVTVIDALAVPPLRRAATTAGTVAREPVLVPESLDLDGVLATLQAAREDFAIVVDEYGGTDGVLTIEDLVEELVGEIADEHDPVDSLGWAGSAGVAGSRTSAGSSGSAFADVAPAADTTTVTAPNGGQSWLVGGLLREDELAELTGFRLPEGPYETLAGFLLARLGHIPVPGERVVEHGWEFTIVEVERRRIEQVEVVAPPEESHD
jgi:CBS domain containing-hemolysin-like protein